MKKVSKVILVLAILAGIILVQSTVLATDTPIVINAGSTNNTTAGSNNTVADANNVVNNTANNTVNNVVNNTTNNTVNKVANNVTNTLPKTGIEDSPAGILIVIGAISAIYAYKKIRDYNV